MFWAVLKLYIAKEKSLTLTALSDQRVIVLHFATLTVYLASLVIYYVFFALWDDEDTKSENKVFVSFAISQILLCLAQLVLIYLFWGLSRP